jgi:hypothetical protein
MGRRGVFRSRRSGWAGEIVVTEPTDPPPMPLEPGTPDHTIPGVPEGGMEPAEVIAESRGVLYPRLYTWVVFLGSMDIIMTWVVLHFGGREANQVAATLMERWGLAGLIALKFASIITVLLISEFVGRRSHGTGRLLVLAAIAISTAPVTLAFGLLVRFVFGPESGANFENLIGN